MVLANTVYHHDVDVTQFGYQPGQVYAMPPHYTSSPVLLDAAEQAAQHITGKCMRGHVASGDAFMGSDAAVAKVRTLFPQTTAVEMEGAAIGQTCYSLNTPFIVIRSLSDIAGKESHGSFLNFLNQAGQQSAQLVMAMIAQLVQQ